MPLTHDELRAMLAHPSVRLDMVGLSLCTGLPQRECRRLGKPSQPDARPNPPVPEALEVWLRHRLREGKAAATINQWAYTRRPESDPPPWLSEEFQPGEVPDAVSGKGRNTGRGSLQNHPLRHTAPALPPQPTRSPTATNRPAASFYKGSKV